MQQTISTRLTLWIVASLVMLLILLGGATMARSSNGTGTADFCARHCGTVEPSCPDPAPCVTTCPDVTCEGTTVIVTPTPCPAPKFPNYVPCRRKNDGTLKCPRPRTPRRVIVPESK